jgi:cell division protein FtsI (penicillin-binding protein 3)
VGYSLVLTLDMDMQTIVENELKQGVEMADAESGSVLAMNPVTGEILAIATFPTFNPNNLAAASAELTRSSCYTDTYEPGSTFKLVTSAALLEEGTITPTSMVTGAETITGRDGVVVVRDEHPVGTVPFSRALEQSSNVVMSTLAQRISSPKFYKYVRDFGFGIFTGIDVPGEVRGTVKKPHEFDYTTKIYMAHGYELSSTVLQLAGAYSTIANGGVMMKPYLVQSILNGANEEVQRFEPQRVRRVVSETTAKTLTTMLCGVVERGTGTNARIPGLREKQARRSNSPKANIPNATTMRPLRAIFPPTRLKSRLLCASTNRARAITDAKLLRQFSSASHKSWSRRVWWQMFR